MIYNLLLYFGIFFIVAGFSLWLYTETKLRDIDIQLFKLEQRIKKELSNVKNWCSCYLCFLYYLNDLFWFIGMGNDTMSKEEIVKELREILKVYHYESDTENMSKDVVTSLENIIISLTTWV